MHPRRFFVCQLHGPGASADASNATPATLGSHPLGSGQAIAGSGMPPVVRVAGPLEEASFRPFRLAAREYMARDFLQLTFALPSETQARGLAGSRVIATM